MTSQQEGYDAFHLWSRPGIIIIDKPRGPSSHEVASWVGRMLGCQVGHAGTLDPRVSGVLLVMLGNAVRLAPLLLRHDKEYVCLLRLHRDVERERILTAADEFTGRLYQRPPRRSAVKRALRIREIRNLSILDIEGKLVLFRVQCDAGTYIRSLCHHIGLALGAGAHMVELRRTRSGPFGETEMHALHDVQDAAVAARAGDPSALASMILPVDAAVPDLPLVTIRDTAIDAVCHGAQLAAVGILAMQEFRQGDVVAVLSQKKEFICIGRALVPSVSFRPGDAGLVVAPTAVFMQPGTYPKNWTKSGKIFPKKEKTGKAPDKQHGHGTGQKKAQGAGRKIFKKTGSGPGRKPRKKGYH